MQKIKGFQLEDNSITKDKIKLTGNDALTGEDIRINENTSETVNNNFSTIDSNINNLNNSTNNLSQQLSQIISYEKNVIELPVTETLSAFTPVGFDSNGNIKKFSTTNELTNPSISTIKTLNFNDFYGWHSLHKITTNVGERIFFGYRLSTGIRILLYTPDENFDLKTNYTNSTDLSLMACNSNCSGITHTQIYPLIINNDSISIGSAYSTGGNYPCIQGDNVSVDPFHSSSVFYRYIRSGNSYSTQTSPYVLSNPNRNDDYLPYNFMEYTSSQFVVHHFTNYWPCKIRTQIIYSKPSSLNLEESNIRWTFAGYFIDLSNNRIFWDDNDGQGLKVINSPVANIRQICQLHNNWYVIFGSSTYKIVPTISTTLNYNNYPTYNHSITFPVTINNNYYNPFTPGQITSSYSLFSVFNSSTKNLTVFKINYTFLSSNFTGILLENANQGEIKKIATPKSIITIPNANFIPGRYYIFNASTNTYEQTSDKNNAIFKALTNNKVYILDNLG